MKLDTEFFAPALCADVRRGFSVRRNREDLGGRAQQIFDEEIARRETLRGRLAEGWPCLTKRWSRTGLEDAAEAYSNYPRPG